MLSDEVQGYIASPDDTIEEAWSKIESNRHRSVIVVDNGKVIGALSDGDIRKAMLAKRLLSTQIKDVMNVNFISIQENDRDKVDEIFKEKDIYIIPVVNSDMYIIDLIIW